MYDREGKNLRGRSIDMFVDGVLMRTAFDALVVDSPARRQSSAALKGPAYFSTVLLQRTSSVRRRKVEQLRVRLFLFKGHLPLNSARLKVCKTVSRRAAAALKSVVADVPESSRKQLSQAFDVARQDPAVVLGVPFAVNDGSLISGQKTINFANRMTTGELVSLLSHWHDDPDQNERGLTRLWGELSRKRTQGVALYRGHHSDPSLSSDYSDHEKHDRAVLVDEWRATMDEIKSAIFSQSD